MPCTEIIRKTLAIRAGRTYNQIVIRTGRPEKHSDAKAKAAAYLREQGLTWRKIAYELGLANGSSAMWLALRAKKNAQAADTASGRDQTQKETENLVQAGQAEDTSASSTTHKETENGTAITA